LENGFQTAALIERQGQEGNCAREQIGHRRAAMIATTVAFSLFVEKGEYALAREAGTRRKGD